MTEHAVHLKSQISHSPSSIMKYTSLMHITQTSQINWTDDTGRRIQSFPLNSVFPLIISAMIQPTDQMSTEINTEDKTLVRTQTHTARISHRVSGSRQCSRSEERDISVLKYLLHRGYWVTTTILSRL